MEHQFFNLALYTSLDRFHSPSPQSSSTYLCFTFLTQHGQSAFLPSPLPLFLFLAAIYYLMSTWSYANGCKLPSPKWIPMEEENLSISYLAIIQDLVVGTDQESTNLWLRIEKKINKKSKIHPNNPAGGKTRSVLLTSYLISFLLQLAFFTPASPSSTQTPWSF